VPPDASAPTDLSLFVAGERVPFDDLGPFQDGTVDELFDHETSDDTPARPTEEAVSESSQEDTSTDDDENNDGVSFRRF